MLLVILIVPKFDNVSGGISTERLFNNYAWSFSVRCTAGEIWIFHVMRHRAHRKCFCRSAMSLLFSFDNKFLSFLIQIQALTRIYLRCPIEKLSIFQIRSECRLQPLVCLDLYYNLFNFLYTAQHNANFAPTPYPRDVSVLCGFPL